MSAASIASLRIVQKEYEHRLNFLERGWIGNQSRIVYLSGQIEQERVRRIVCSSMIPKEQAALITTKKWMEPKETPSHHCKRPKTSQEASSPERYKRPDPLAVNALVQTIYSYTPYEDRTSLARVDYTFYANHLPAYIEDLTTLKTFDWKIAQTIYAKRLKCTPGDVFHLQRSLDRIGIPSLEQNNCYMARDETKIASHLLHSPLMSRVTTITIDASFHIQDEHLISIAKTCRQQLKRLWISVEATRFNDITDHSVFVLGQSCGNLTELTLRKCGITDESVMAITRGCQHLKILDLAFCFNLTDASVLVIAGSVPHLAEVSIFDWRGVKTLSLVELVKTHSVLRKLSCPMAMGIVDPLAEALAGSCLDLRTLSMNFSHLSTAALAKLLERCRSLETLSIGGSKLDKEAGAIIARYGKGLKSLYITIAATEFLDTAPDLARSLPSCSVDVEAVNNPVYYDLNNRLRETLGRLRFDLTYIPHQAHPSWIDFYQNLLRAPDQMTMDQLREQITAPFQDMIVSSDETEQTLFWQNVQKQLSSLRYSPSTGGAYAFSPWREGHRYTTRALQNQDIRGLSPCVMFDALYQLGYEIPLPDRV